MKDSGLHIMNSRRRENARVLAVVTDPDPTDGKYYSVDQLRKNNSGGMVQGVMNFG